MSPIKRHHRSAGSLSERQDLFVRDALARLACLVRGQYAVSELTQLLDHGITEILVSIQLSHQLRFLSLLDGPVNLVAIVRVVFPGGF